MMTALRSLSLLDSSEARVLALSLEASGSSVLEGFKFKVLEGAVRPFTAARSTEEFSEELIEELDEELRSKIVGNPFRSSCRRLPVVVQGLPVVPEEFAGRGASIAGRPAPFAGPRNVSEEISTGSR